MGIFYYAMEYSPFLFFLKYFEFCRLTSMVFFFKYLSFITWFTISSFDIGPFFFKSSFITSRTTPDLYPHSDRAYMPRPTRTNLGSLISSLWQVAVWHFLLNVSVIALATSLKCMGEPCLRIIRKA